MRQLEDEEALGRDLHPGADHGHQLPLKPQAVVAVVQGSEGTLPESRWRWRLRARTSRCLHRLDRLGRRNAAIAHTSSISGSVTALFASLHE